MWHFFQLIEIKFIVKGKMCLAGVHSEFVKNEKDKKDVS